MQDLEKSITDFPRALHLFVDRRENIRTFLQYLNDESRNTILFFHGDGANGKTLLLGKLKTTYCKRVEWNTWEYLRTLDDDDFVSGVEQTDRFEKVPSALLDFRNDSIEGERPKDAFYALLMLRRDLSRDGLRTDFAVFDYACVMYLYKKGLLTSERLKSLFPAEAMDFIGSLADAITSTSYGSLASAFLTLINKSYADKFRLYLLKRNVEAGLVESIEKMDADKELIKELPRLFAEDLNAAMRSDGAPERGVLFFDTHEAFWGYERNIPTGVFFERDEWFRYLLGRLNRCDGVVTVVSGRDKPKWEDATRYSIAGSSLDIQSVGYLPTRDADDYLIRVGIADSVLRSSLTTYAQVEEGQVHPLLLGLAADIILEAKSKEILLTPTDFQMQNVSDKGLEQSLVVKGKALTQRLLLHVNEDLKYAVYALSACRSFNRGIYTKLGQQMSFAATESAFRTLTQFSFVWKSEQRGEGWYRIHDLIRRLLRDLDDQDVRTADEVLEKHYIDQAKRGERGSVIEAIYHINQLDWRRGIDEWAGTFDSALQGNRFDLCRELVSLLADLSVRDDLKEARVAALVGDYFLHISSYEEAKQEFSKSISLYVEGMHESADYLALNDKSIALHLFGGLNVELAQYDQALENYEQSIGACDSALQQNPDYLPALKNKGFALGKLGHLQALLAHQSAALETYKKSVNSFDEALRRDPTDYMLYNNKGLTLKSLADLQSTGSLFGEGEDSYTVAIRAFDEATNHCQNVTAVCTVKSNKANALAGLALLQATVSKYEDAIDSYERSIVIHDEVLALNPDSVYAYNNKAAALLAQGELQVMTSEYGKALDSHARAVESCNESLRRAPDFVNAYLNKGTALENIGDLQARVSQLNESIISYKEAIENFDKALRLAPDSVQGHSNRGIAFHGLGDSQVKLTLLDEAPASYAQSIKCFEQVLQRAPDAVYAYNNQGNVFKSLGNLQTQLSEYSNAMDSYQKAIAVYDRALSVSPHHPTWNINKATVFQEIGDLFAETSKFDFAVAKYEEGIKLLDDVMCVAPNSSPAHIAKGTMLGHLGYLLSALSRTDLAVATFNEALEEFSEALKTSPNDAAIRQARDNTLELLRQLRGE